MTSPHSRFTNAVSNALSVLFVVYILGTSIAAMYFNWNYARDNGFVKWFLLGQIVPTAKSFIWPYYLVRGVNKPEAVALPRSVQNFFYATDALVRANERPSQIEASSNVARVRALLKEAVDSAHGIDRSELNGLYPGLGDHFLDDAISGAQLFIEAIDQRDRDLIMRGTAAHLRWQNWWNNNASAVMSTMADRYRLEVR